VVELLPNGEAERILLIYSAILVSRRGKGRGDKDREKSLGYKREEMKAV